MNLPIRTCLAALSLSSFATSFASALQLAPLTTFGTNGNGTILPGERSYLTSDGSRYQRGMAFNPATGHLLIVNRSPIGAETINIIDAATGEDVGVLNVCCPTFGGSASFLYNMIGVADDGAIYIGNLTTAAGAVTFNLYRWASETNAQTVVYSGDPRNGNPAAGSARWGDTLIVRGSGINTEALIATQSGTLAAMLKPADSSMAIFTATTLTTSLPGGGIGYALAFGPGNTFYGKGASGEGNPLDWLSYDLIAGATITLQTNGVNQFPGRIGALAAQVTSNLLAAIEMTSGTNADLVRLYSIANTPTPPTFLDREIVATATNANSIFAGAVTFGRSNVYTLNSDNGIAAFTIAEGIDSLPPVVFQGPQSRITQITSNVVFTVGADGSLPLPYQWYFNATNLLAGATNLSLTLTNVTIGNAGLYSVVVTNIQGSVTSSVAVLTVLPNFGNLLVYDPFAYTLGTMLPGLGEWTMTSAAANGAVEAGNLHVPGLAAPVGDRYTWTNNSSVRKPFGQYSAGEVYCSFAFRLDTASTSTANETFAGFSFGTSTTFPLKFNIIGDGAGGYQLGIYKGGGTSGNGSIDANQTFIAGQTIFVVGRYSFREGGANDICDLWINPVRPPLAQALRPRQTSPGPGMARPKRPGRSLTASSGAGRAQATPSAFPMNCGLASVGRKSHRRGRRCLRSATRARLR